MTETMGLRARLISIGRSLAPYGERQSVRCLVLVLVGVIVRFPALQGPFLWDDTYLVTDNPFIKSPLIILEAFRHYLFPDSYAGHYRPIQTISYIPDYLIWNTDAYGYHLSNLVWHISSGLLLYLLLEKLLRLVAPHFIGRTTNAEAAQSPAILPKAAFIIALLWVVHPVHSAAIDYISGRADSLSCFFASAGWLLYLKAGEISRKVFRWSCYFLAALSGLFSLCSRETGFVWMMIFILCLFIFDRKPTLRAKLCVLACCLTLAGTYGTLRMLPEFRPGHDVHPASGIATKGVLMLRALGDYGRLMVWPSNLHMDRDVMSGNSSLDTTHWRQSIQSEYLSIAGLFVAALLLLGAARKGVAQRIRVFGAGWFLITYLPISNLFDLNATVAEHWLYLPSVGLLVFLAGCYLELPRPVTRFALPLICMAVIGLGARSFVRSSDWVTEETFYQRTLLAGGTSPRMCVNLAAIFSKRGEYGKAERLLRRVLQADPSYPVARTNLASILSSRGETGKAEELFASASKTTVEERSTFPRTWSAAINLARLAHDRGDDETALAITKKARQDYPGTWNVIRFEAELLRKTRGPDAALALVQEFAHQHWWHYGAFIALGRLFFEKGDVLHAEAAFKHATRLDVHDGEALGALALMKIGQNRLQEALQAQRRAISRQPDEVRPYLLLATILEKMGRTAEAEASIAQAARMEAIGTARSPAN